MEQRGLSSGGKMKTLKLNVSGLSKVVGLGAIAMIAAAGCGNKSEDAGGTAATGGEAGNTLTGKSVAQNFGDAANTVSGAGQSAANGVAGAGDVAGNMAAGAGNEVAGAGNVAKNMGSAAVNTGPVKAALGANAALKGSNINVDSTSTQVTLNGTVKSEAQKTLAVTIAKKNASSLKVVDNLKVVK